MKFDVIDPNDLINNLYSMLQRLIGEDICIETELEKGAWGIKADRVTIEQIILNLAINSRAAMPSGGTLRITTKNKVLDSSDPIPSIMKTAKKFVVLTVADTGTGMDKKTLKHIFEPFFTTKSPGSGTGLGLSVVYGIVKQHSGNIQVQSEPGKGTCFTITFPASQDEPVVKQDIQTLPQFSRGHGERVLVVEDDDQVRKFAMNVLSQTGYAVYSASNAEDAIRLFEEEKGDFQLIISDVVLPGKTGIELVDELISRKPNLSVLMGSGYIDQKSQWQVIKRRGFRFLQKPYVMVDLLNAVHQTLNPN
jgi:CheY-like chemotaxis protein